MRISNRPAVLCLVALALPLAAAAQGDSRYRDTGHGRLSYTLGEVRVVARDPDGAGDADGVSIGGSALITPDLFLAGSATTVGSGNYDEDTLDLGVGMRYAVGPRIDLVGVAGLVFGDRQVGNRDFGSDVGPALTAGLRSPLTPEIEVGAYASYVRLYEDGDLGLRGEGLYHFTPNFSALASLGLTDNERNASLGVRWYFRPGS